MSTSSSFPVARVSLYHICPTTTVCLQSRCLSSGAAGNIRETSKEVEERKEVKEVKWTIEKPENN